MDWKLILLWLSSLLLAFLFGYYMCDDGNALLSCNKDKKLVQFCADTSSIDYGWLKEDDTFLKDLYSKSFAVGDSIGFSIGSDLTLKLAMEVLTSTSYGGFHLYPGMDNSGLKYLIKIPLNGDGIELPDVGSRIKLNPDSNILGPCPRWCGDDSRVVITPP